MTLLVEADFASDAEGFSAGSRVGSPGWDFADGYLSVPSNTTASKSFTAVSSGTVRVEWWVYAPDTETAADTSKDTTFYILPTAGAVSLANSLCTVTLSRNTTYNASTNYWRLRLNSSGSMVNLGLTTNELVGRSAWVKLAVNIDYDADTYDFYFNDVLWFRGVGVANTSAADISRFVAVTASSAPATYLDGLVVESGWAVTDDESVLIDHDFTAESGGQDVDTLTPDTNNRHIYNQPWKAPENTTYGVMATSGSNGLAAEASKDNIALYACRPEGVLEIEFRTSASSSNAIYIGAAFRAWGGLGSDSYLLFRYWPGSSNDWALFLGSTVLASSATTPTVATNTTATLKVEMRGRYLTCSVKSAAMDSGSYTQVFSHRVDATATGARGLLSEEHCGVILGNSLGAVGTDNYVRRFRFTGSVPSEETSVAVGENTWKLCHGSAREWYRSDVVEDERNLFWSKGIQSGHRGTQDMGNYAMAQATLLNETNVKAYRQRSLNVAEADLGGVSDVYWTFTRRGVWCSDGLLPWGARNNFAPDCDYRGELYVPEFRTIGPTGSANTDTDATYHDWTSHVASVALPVGFQSLTSPASGDTIRDTQIIGAITGLSGAYHNMTSKWQGNGGPISRVATRYEANITDFTALRFYRAVIAEGGSLSLDGALLAEVRDDLGTIATFSWTTGSSKTDAAGDDNTDGFNERHGWYEVNASSNELDFTLTVGSYDRHYPQFLINSWTGGASPAVTIAGSGASAGTDYVFTDFGDGTALLELLSVRSADTAITVAEAVPTYTSGASLGSDGAYNVGTWDSHGNGTITYIVSAVNAAGDVLESAVTSTGTLDLSGNSGNTCYLLVRASNNGGYGEGDYATRTSGFGSADDGYYEVASVVAAGGGVTGTGSATAPAATSSGTGAIAIAGTAAMQATSPTASGSGVVSITGTGSAVSPNPSSSGVGSVAIAGAGGMTAPSPVSAGSGAVASAGVSGFGSSTAPAASSSGVGAVPITGAGSSTAPSPTAAGEQTPTVIIVVGGNYGVLPARDNYGVLPASDNYASLGA